MIALKEGMTMLNELDIHGMQKMEAKAALDNFLNHLPKSIHEVVIIHGYRGGNALQTFVRKQYHHHRVLRSMICMNAGETILVLKTDREVKK